MQYTKTRDNHYTQFVSAQLMKEQNRFDLVSGIEEVFACPAILLQVECRVEVEEGGGDNYPVSGATVWNDLPLHIASAPSLTVFRQRLKTFLFSRSYQDTII